MSEFKYSFMVKYKFFLQVKSSNEKFSYVLDLNLKQEASPHLIFTEEIRESMRKHWQKQSSYVIKDNHIERIIQTWIEDIKEGYRESTLSLDLPLLIEENIKQLNEQGNQDLPNIINPDLSGIEPYWGMLPPLEQIFQSI
jgi:hypothetical protein